MDNQLKNSIKDFLSTLFISIILMLACCVLFKLGAIEMIINACVSIVFCFLLVKLRVKKCNEKERFYEAVTYLEQMIYSFLKLPKIRESLLDVCEISNGRLKKTVRGALNLIDDGKDTNIFQKAFGKLEQVYNCEHIFFLHKYLVKLETEGGEYEVFLNLILKDIKNWSNTVIEYRISLEKKKRSLFFAIAVTLISSGLLVRMVPEEFSFTQLIPYKVIISICLNLMFLTFLYFEHITAKSWLEKYNQLSESKVRMYDNLVQHGRNKKSKILTVVISVLLIISSLCIYLLDKRVMSLIVLLFSILMVFYPKIYIKSVKLKMSRELQKGYGNWLLDFGMNLQFETVQTALYHSYKNAPIALKPELERVLKSIIEYPVSIVPYDLFLDKYDLNDMKSSFRMLYPMQELEREQVIKHLELLIDRSQLISRKSFELQQEDKVGVLTIFLSVPSLLGVFIILTSIFLLITNFSVVLNESLNGIYGMIGG